MTTPKKPIVLVVDDEDLFRTAAVEALRGALPDYRFVQASNGKKALDRAQGQEIHLVVTDIRMPEMGGTELLLALRERGFRGGTIVMTAFGDEKLEQEVRELGALVYLEKPLELFELASAVKSSVEGYRSYVEGLTLAGFTQLLQLERKTCRLRIFGDERSGDLFFEDGRLQDARAESLQGDDAALEIFGWEEDTQFELLSDLSPRSRTVSLPLHELLLEAARLRDERHFDTSRRSAATEEPLTPTHMKENAMASPKEAMAAAMEIDGAVGVALVDYESGMSLGQAGGGDAINLDVAGAGNTEVVRAKMATMSKLGLNESIEDILITLESQYHLIRPLKSAPSLFLYLALDRSKSNLAMARHQLSKVEDTLEI